ncbi:MAG: hypothetical protein MUP17_05780 [candidate division Zixibacteria bacterium]|nr:hypothetical protein [candidate division Zixibacteria bacterium]
MKIVAMRLEDTTIEILDAKAKEQGITVSEYLRHQIFPLIEGTKTLTLEQCLAKLDHCLSLAQFCVRPLQGIVFDLQKFKTELVLKLEQEKAPQQEQEQLNPPQEEEKNNEGKTPQI